METKEKVTRKFKWRGNLSREGNYYFTCTPCSWSSTCFSYQKDERVKPGNLPKWNHFAEIWEDLIEKHFHFFIVFKGWIFASISISTSKYLTAFVTSHGKIKPYLHRFKTIESPDCPCGGGSQTVDHLLFDCTILQDERERLIGKIARHDNWPVNKSQLGNKYMKHFIQFTNSIDFTKLWDYKPGEISAYKWTINNITECL